MDTRLESLMFFVLFFGQIPYLFAFQPSGGVLVLDGVDDYAVLPFEEHGILIPKGSREFTIEAWVYPERQTESGDREVILSQQAAFESWPFKNPWFAFNEGEDNAYVLLFAYLQDAGAGAHGCVSFHVTIKKNQWNYLALILKDGKVGMACNQMIEGTFAGFGDQIIDDMNKLVRPKDFVVGGYHQTFDEWNGIQLSSKVTYFHGYIDAIMISDVARYDSPVGWEGPFDPPHRFEKDRNTLALWNFDDGEGATRFSDASGNGYTLVGENGAHVQGWLSVNSLTSISTTWGQIKYSTQD